MPIYVYRCPAHGEFEVRRGQPGEEEECSVCGAVSPRSWRQAFVVLGPVREVEIVPPRDRPGRISLEEAKREKRR